MSIKKQSFGKTPDAKDVDLYILTNANGLTAKVTGYGVILTSLKTPDRDGKFADIVLGYDTLQEYIDDTFYLRYNRPLRQPHRKGQIHTQRS